MRYKLQSYIWWGQQSEETYIIYDSLTDTRTLAYRRDNFFTIFNAGSYNKDLVRYTITEADSIEELKYKVPWMLL